MKKLSKIIALAVCTVMVCLVFTGCASQFHGTWKSVAIEEKGEKYTKDDDNMGEVVKSFMTIEIEKGGEGKLTAMGESKDIEWKADGDTITLTANKEDIDAELKDDQLVLDLDGVKVYLEKED